MPGGGRPETEVEAEEAEVLLQRRQRSYWCRVEAEELRIRNASGEEMGIPLHETNVQGERHPYVQGLIDEASLALGLVA